MRYLISVVVITVLFSTSILASPASASVSDLDIFRLLEDTDDYTEIRTLTEEMLKISSNLYDTGELKQKMTTTDIDFSKAVKIYMDRQNSLIGLNANNVDEMSSYLRTAEYIWEIPVDVGNQTVSFTLNIGKEVKPEIEDLLTEEEKEFINSKIDKWIIVRTAWGSESGIDYKQFVKNQITRKSLSDENTYVLIGGIPEVNHPVAIEINGEHLEAVVPACVGAERSLSKLIETSNEQIGLPALDFITFEQLKQYIMERN